MFGFRRVVQAAVQVGTRGGGRFRQQSLFAQELSQSDAAQSTAEIPKELAAIGAV